MNESLGSIRHSFPCKRPFRATSALAFFLNRRWRGVQMGRQGTLVAAVLRQRTFHKKWAESLARCRRRPPFQRHLFNFGASPASKSFTENRVVPFTPEEVFSVVIDVDKYKEFVPFCVESRVTRRDNENKFFAIMGVGFKIFTESYTSEITTKVPSGTSPGDVDIKALDSSTFETLRSKWSFAPGPKEDTCAITFNVSFTVANPLAAAAVSNFFGTIAEQQMRAFAKRCEKLYAGKHADKAEAQGEPAKGNDAAASQTRSLKGGRGGLTEDAALTLRVLRSHMPIGWTHEESGQSEKSTLQPADQKHRDFLMPYESFSAACDQLAGMVDGFEILGDPQNASVRTNADKLTSGATTFEEDRLDDGTGEGGTGADPFTAEVSPASTPHPHLIRMAIYESASQLQTVKDAIGNPEKALRRFARALYAMVAANPEERAKFIFDLIDTNKDDRLSHQEMNQAMRAHILAVAAVIPKIMLFNRGLLSHNDFEGTPTEAIHEVLSDSCDPDPEVQAALAKSKRIITRVTEEAVREVPLAVEQILKEVDEDNSGDLSYAEWLDAWHRHPEVLDLMSVKGMTHLVEWASVVESDQEVVDEETVPLSV